MSNQQGGFFGLLRMHELYKYLIVVEQKCDTSIEVILHDYVTDVHFVSRQDRLLGLSTLDFLITVKPLLRKMALMTSQFYFTAAHLMVFFI